ncbi:Os07g0575550, partial [Oryza sativa Japonica Group]
HRHLPADHQPGLLGGEPARDVVVVHPLPRLVRSAPRPAAGAVVAPRVVVGGVVAGEVAVAAVEVVERRRRDDGPVPGAHDQPRVVAAVVPRLQDRRLRRDRRRGHVHRLVQQHVLPVHRRPVPGHDQRVRRADELLEEAAERAAAGEVALDGRVGVPAPRRDLVGAGVVEAVREEGGDVVDDVGHHLVRLGLQRVELAGARLGGKSAGPVRRVGQPELAGAGHQLGVSSGPRRRVA